jgi:hypothetical protein
MASFKTSAIALVMVAGEVVLREGCFTRVDKEARCGG